MINESVSVIIPVYNTDASFLERSIGSVLRSTYPDIELLLVDDGSDKSVADRLKDYEASDKRIRAFLCEHRGVVKAREFGVEKASGKWVMFLDSDDYIEADMIQKMLDCAGRLSSKSPDIILADCIREPSGKIRREPLEIREYDMSDETIRRSMIDKVFQGENISHINDSYWGKLFKREFVEKIAGKVDKRITQGEDLCFILLAVAAAGLIVNTAIVGYHYCPRIDSVSSTKNPHYLANLDIMYNSVREYLKEFAYEEEYDDIVEKWRNTILHLSSRTAKILLG